MATDEDFIGGYRLDHIYANEFREGKGKFFNVITLDDGNTEVEYIQPFPQTRNRVKLTVTFIRDQNDIKEVTLKKFKYYKNEGWQELPWGAGEPMKLSHFTFEKLMAFLQLLTELDLINLKDRRIGLQEGASAVDPETTQKLKRLLSQDGGGQIIDELLANGMVTSHDIVNLGYRKRQLEVFRGLLREEGYLDLYRQEHEIKSRQVEKIWQHFLARNEWIFGFGLDYKFLGILQDEADIGTADLAGRDAAIVDFLLGSSHFTVLVEVKKPRTPLFDSRRNRAGSWALSNELVDAVSQVLEQKAAWQVKAEANARKNFDRSGALIDQRTVDPKCILLIGGDGAFSGTPQERELKLRTFELFRRDSRNIEILTYDELFERASFVVNNSVRPK